MIRNEIFRSIGSISARSFEILRANRDIIIVKISFKLISIMSMGICFNFDGRSIPFYLLLN